MAVGGGGGEAFGWEAGFASDPVGGGFALLGDVVGEGENAEGAGAGEEGGRRQAGHEAGFLAQMDPVVDDVGLGGVGQEDAVEDLFGFLEAAHNFEQAALLDLQGDAVGFGLEGGSPGG